MSAQTRNTDSRLDVPLVDNRETNCGSEQCSASTRARLSPESSSGFLRSITFGWLSPIIAEGYRRERQRARASNESPAECPRELPVALTEDDLYELRAEDFPKVLSSRATETWSYEVQRSVESRSLRRALQRAFGATFFAAAGFKFVYDSLQMAGPYLLKEVLSYLGRCEESAGDCNLEKGLTYIGLMFASAVLQTALLHQYFHRCFRTGMRLNAASISLIYGKALKTAGPGKRTDSEGSAVQQRTSGEIVNLMSVDSQRLQDTMTYLHTLWSGPYQIIITLIFLYFVVGWATLAGLAVMLLQIPVVTCISRRIKLAQRALMGIKDERIKVTNEVFGSIRLLKMYGWEDSFENRLNSIREKELKQLRRYQLLNIVSSTIWSVAPILTGLATFGVYSFLYGRLSPATAFTALSLFNVLRFPLTMFPNMVSSSVEATVALKRIQDFLESQEVSGRMQTAGTSAGAALVEDGWDVVAKATSIDVANASIEWPGGTPLLSGVTFSVPAAQQKAHIAVILGAVGTGKSGLLQALIGDLRVLEGTMRIHGSIAYTSQVAWIRNATVKDNIIFNSQFDQERYSQVLNACALLPDLEVLPQGDATEIGEKGVNLSGGQKQRISLARAIYANASVLLLDDPLSAVDSEVAKKLIKMLRGPLVRNTSIVLCTHHPGAVQQADQIVVLERGSSQSVSGQMVSRVAFCGTPETFATTFPNFFGGDSVVWQRQPSSEEQSLAQEDIKKGKQDAAEGRLVQKETEQVGSVPFEVYKDYIGAAGGLPLAASVIAGVICGQALQTGADAWISYWSDHSNPSSEHYISSSMGLIGYSSLSMAAFVGIFMTSGLFRLTALKAARSFHKRLLHSLLNLPMKFFDTTPLGRVLNRFSKDVYTIDEQLQSTLYSYLTVLTRVFATIVVIAFATPWFLAIIVPLLWIYNWTKNYYIPSSRQLKRIEANLRSPVFSHFSETLDGVSSIRAFGQQSQFLAENAERLQRNMRAYYLNVASNRWLAVRLEGIGSLIVSSAGVLAVLAHSSISAGVAGLSISYALSVTQALNWVVRMSADRETNIVSVERVQEYLRLTPEPEHRKPGDPSPSVWPLEGSVELVDVRVRYRPELPLVLDGLSLRVEPREKLGICGRTGAGKSSVLNVLLRIVDPEGGRVVIDGLDIATLGLHCLRHSITIIPQDPVLFSGTLKFNLDPLCESTNEQIWEALRCSHLSGHIESLGGSSPTSSQVDLDKLLNAAVAEHGKNFSLGQRQQMCLARALLRSNRILLLDEATSAVDMETDSLIQETIRKEFSSHTVLCIAHRISTIMESDRVCVLEAGRLAELGSPKELMQKPDSRFRELARLDATASRDTELQ